ISVLLLPAGVPVDLRGLRATAIPGGVPYLRGGDAGAFPGRHAPDLGLARMAGADPGFGVPRALLDARPGPEFVSDGGAVRRRHRVHRPPADPGRSLLRSALL